MFIFCKEFVVKIITKKCVRSLILTLQLFVLHELYRDVAKVFVRITDNIRYTSCCGGRYQSFNTCLCQSFCFAWNNQFCMASHNNVTYNVVEDVAKDLTHVFVKPFVFFGTINFVWLRTTSVTNHVVLFVSQSLTNFFVKYFVTLCTNHCAVHPDHRSHLLVVLEIIPNTWQHVV